jgi:protein-S-isoprenylcysteine O-methyltransferase Ste14
MLYWLISSFTVKRSVKAEAGISRIIYLCFFVLAGYLTFTGDIPFSLLYLKILPQENAWKIFGFIICAIGISYAIWARAYLGKNWSGRVTIKEDHELITKGPYAITRHPIYAGILTGLIGYAFIEGLVKGYLAIAIIMIGMLIKIYREERFLKETFGEKYQLYSLKVKRLIPYIF